MLQVHDARYPFQGIHMLGPDAEVYYAARVQEVYDGFFWLGSPFYSSPKELPYVQPPLPEWTIAAIGWVFGLSSVMAFFVAKALLSAASSIALTCLLFFVTRRPWISLLASFVTLTAGALLAGPWDVLPFLTGKDFSYEFLRFSRLLHPLWTTTVTFVSLLFLAAWIRSGRRWHIVGAACATAALIYAYLYAWSYVFAIVGILCLWFLVRRERQRIVDLLLFWSIILVLSLPYVWHLSLLIQHPWYAETAMRSGMVLRHGPVIFGVWSIIFIVMALLTRRWWPGTWPLLPAVAIAGIIALNQHLVTGHFIVPHHYHWYFIQPLASAFAIAFGLTLLSSRRWGRVSTMIACFLLVAFSASCAFIQQRGAYEGVSGVWGPLQRAAPVLSYVRDHLQVGEVIYTIDPNVQHLIPLASSADVFFAGNANLSLVPDDRARFTYFVDLWLQGVTPDDAQETFPTTRRWMLSSRIHAIFYREAAGDFAAMPDAEVRQHIDAYKDFFALSLREKLSHYPLSAVVTTPNDPQNPTWDRFLSCSEEVFASNGYALRMMIPAGRPHSCL